MKLSKELALPCYSGLDVSALTRLFANTTNSYKFLFFLSLLDILKRNKFKPDLEVSFSDITVEMLANSWYPHIYFKLSFGLRDKITSVLDSLELTISKPILEFKDADKRLLRQTIAGQPLDNALMKYVPYRILRPFFEVELRNVPEPKIDATIVKLANTHFVERKPLYCFRPSNDAIVLHPTWIEYIRINFNIIKAWAAWSWLEYMQMCNRGVPAVASKLFPPPKRDSLKRQTEYWKAVVERSKVKCIYSDEVLTVRNFSLDHYLPWSFLAHDQIWNLIPTLREINSSKSASLPDQSYFDRFVELQHQGLIVTKSHFSQRRWGKYVEPFFADLNIASQDDLLVFDKLRHAYDSNVLPLIELAKSCGFSADWRFSK